MHEPKQRDQDRFDRIDADAVCEKCSAVNPPETVFCKNCGNNLRDQRAERLHMQEVQLVGARRPEPRRILSALLTVFGLLLVLWTALNVQNIENWMTEGMTAETAEPTGNPEDYWSGATGRFYDLMAARVIETQLTVEDIEAAQLTPFDGDFEGRYVLQADRRPTAPIIGQAYVQSEGEMLHFVAMTTDDVEYRGVFSAAAQTAVADMVAVSTPAGYLSASGSATLSAQGGFDLRGQLPDSDEVINAVAYHIPNAAEAAPAGE